jgi:hypothetical protein
MFNFWCEWTVLDRGSCYSVNITCFRDVCKETLAREAIYSCVADSDLQTSLSDTHKAHRSVAVPHTCQYYEHYYFLEGWVGYEMDTTSPVQVRLNNLQALQRYVLWVFVSSPELTQCFLSEVFSDVFRISIRKRWCLSYRNKYYSCNMNIINCYP